MTSRRLLSPIGKVLLDAADLIERNGHCKCRLQDEEGRVCAMGAIMLATVGFPKEGWDHDSSVYKLYERAYHFFADAMEMSGYPYMAIEIWNDATARQPDEVVNALRQAAIAAVPAE